MLTTEAPDVCELALHGFTTKEAGGLAVILRNGPNKAKCTQMSDP